MAQIIMATFENGILRPDEPLNLPAQARVRLTLEPLAEGLEVGRAWLELEQLWDEAMVDSGGQRFTRDQLHERR